MTGFDHPRFRLKRDDELFVYLRVITLGSTPESIVDLSSTDDLSIFSLKLGSSRYLG